MYRIIRHSKRKSPKKNLQPFDKVSDTLGFIKKHNTIPLVQWVFDHDMYGKTVDPLLVEQCLELIRFLKQNARRLTFSEFQMCMGGLNKMISGLSSACLRRELLELRNFRRCWVRSGRLKGAATIHIKFSWKSLI